MNREQELQHILTSNEPHRRAIEGLASPIAHYFKRRGIRGFSRQLIERQFGEFRHEFGVSKINWIKAVVLAIRDIGHPARADYLLSSMAMLPEAAKKRMTFGDWIQKVFAEAGEMAALGIAGNRCGLEMRKFTMKKLMSVEVV